MFLPTLRLTAERIREELFTGGFRPMKEQDFYGFADAEIGSLIADEVKVGRFVYTVLFTPSLGNVQIFSFDDGESSAWEMDLQTGEFLEL